MFVAFRSAPVPPSSGLVTPKSMDTCKGKWVRIHLADVTTVAPN